MAETGTFEFSPQVKSLVADAMQNKTNIAILKPQVLPDPNRKEPYTEYDLSEFYQLRKSCVVGTVVQAAGIYGIKKEEAGKVCDAVLATAADQMRKGVPVTDPTHLLAQYLVSQRNRGYKAEDGDPVTIALAGAIATATVNINDRSANDTANIYDIRKAMEPALWPKSVPATQPLVLASFKGGAKDAGFSAAVGFPLATGKTFLNESLIYIPSASQITEESPACNMQGNSTIRKTCAAVGYSSGNDYMRDVRAKAR